MEEFTKEINNIVSEYRDVHDSLNVLEKDIQEKMNVHVKLSNKLDILREKEKEIINNIEKETGETLTPSYLYNLMLSETSKS